MRRSHRSVAIAAGAVLALSAIQPALAGSETNCAFALQPTGADPGSGEVDATLVSLGCYGTYAEALAAGSGGAIQVPSSTTPASLSDAVLQQDTVDSPTSSILIGTEWTSTGYTGASNSYFASSTCTSSTTWQVNYVGDTWNDRFESGKGFGGCDTNKKFHDADYLGSVLTCTPNCSDYGSLRDQVSSLKWRV